MKLKSLVISSIILILVPFTASAATVEELTAQINALLAQVTALQAVAPSSPAVVPVNETLKPGCTSRAGFSVTTGNPCASNISYPLGCTSGVGFSQTTGRQCTALPVGCSSEIGFSPITGARCLSENSLQVLQPQASINYLPSFSVPVPTISQTAVPAATPVKISLPSVPTVSCTIKGNIGFTTGEKIYHVIGCPYYNSTVINSSYGERMFCSEQDARSAGWRKAYDCP